MNTWHRPSVGFILLFLCIVPWTGFSQHTPEWKCTSEAEFSHTQLTNRIASCDERHYLACGLRDLKTVVLASQDAGHSWTTVLSFNRYPIGTPQPPVQRPFLELMFTAVSRPSPEVCLVYGKGRFEQDGTAYPVLLRSLDSGNTWHEVLLPDSSRGVSDPCIVMRDELHGIRSGGFVDMQHSVMYKTTDGCESWVSVAVPFTDYRLRSLQCAHDGTLFATEWRSDVPVYRSLDDGGSWEWMGELPARRDPFFANADTGWLAYGIHTGVGDIERDVVVRSIDGGRSWQVVLDTLQRPEFGLLAVAAADSRNVIAAGRDGKLLHSSDAGEHWERAARPFYLYDPAVYAVSMGGKQSAVGCGLLHLVTYTGRRILFPPVARVESIGSALQWTAHWSRVDGADEYQLELVQDMPSSSLRFELFDESPYKQSIWMRDTSLLLESWLSANRDFFVRVRCRDAVTTSDWSWPVKFTTVPSTGMESSPQPSTMHVDMYPVPADASLTIHVSGIAASARWIVELYDLVGRKLLDFSGSGERREVIALPQDASGMVLMQIRSGSELLRRLLPLRER